VLNDTNNPGACPWSTLDVVVQSLWDGHLYDVFRDLPCGLIESILGTPEYVLYITDKVMRTDRIVIQEWADTYQRSGILPTLRVKLT
jgi:hypothetical protein